MTAVTGGTPATLLARYAADPARVFAILADEAGPGTVVPRTSVGKIAKQALRARFARAPDASPALPVSRTAAATHQEEV